MATLATLLDASLRMAGILMRPGFGGSTDMYAELIPALNRMVKSWNIDGFKIYNTSIATYPLTTAKTYTIGSGGDFNAARPNYIAEANLLFPTTPVVRWPIHIIRDDREWAAIRVQDVPGAPTWRMYPDGGYPLTTLYLYPQPPAGYTLELFTWQALQAFTASSDTVVLPDGYDEAITTNLAIRAAALYPTQANLSPEVPALAAKALRSIIALNQKSPALKTESAFRQDAGNPYGWLDGGIR